jgi:RNA polymerase sigma factor (TIGR02999 family)
MTEVTQLLEAAHRGDRRAAAELLPLVYAELRKLAAGHMAREQPGQTLNPTALVHEAFLRLVGPEDHRKWDSRGHFFSAAAEAMRRILVDVARRKAGLKHGGQFSQVELPRQLSADSNHDDEILAVNEALDLLTERDGQAAQIVKLHCFAGLTMEQSAAVLGVSTRKAFQIWSFARAWLFRALQGGESEKS